MNSLNTAKEKAREAITNSKNAGDALLSAAIAYMNAGFKVDIARAKMERACAFLGTANPRCKEAIDVLTLAEDEQLKAFNVFKDAMKKLSDADKALLDAYATLKAAKEAYDNCMKTVPGICQKCKEGNIVPDDSLKPGICLKCRNGAQVPDNSEDPGICWKCEDGIKVIDDSEKPGKCLRCENGEVVDDEIAGCNEGEICCFGSCTNTDTDPVNCGACGNICASGEECCDGGCRKPIYEFTVTTTVTTCNGSNTEPPYTFQTNYPDSVTTGCVSTGELTYSYGVCTGGSVTTICTVGPVRKTCQ